MVKTTSSADGRSQTRGAASQFCPLLAVSPWACWAFVASVGAEHRRPHLPSERPFWVQAEWQTEPLTCSSCGQISLLDRWQVNQVGTQVQSPGFRCLSNRHLLFSVTQMDVAL